MVDYTQGRTAGETMPEVGWKGTTSVLAGVRLVDGDGAVHPVKGRLPGSVMWLMAEGDNVPVRIDEHGRPVGFDREAIEARYAGRDDELRAAQKEQSSVFFEWRRLKEGLADLPRAAKDLRSVPKDLKDAITAPVELEVPDTDPAPPIAGVGFAAFVATQAELVRGKVPPERHDEVAQRHGAPPGAWATAGPAWMDLVKRDPAVAQAFGAAYAAAIRG